MDYGEVLSRAWQIIWKHKALWVFGILAGCANSGGGGQQGNLINYSFSSNEIPPGMENFFRQFEQMSSGQITTLVIIGILLFLLFIVLAVFLSTMGRIGLYRGTQLADGGEARLPFGQLFRESLPYFWRVFFLNLLIGLVIFLVVLLLIGVGVLGTVITLGLALVCLIPLLCLVVPLSWLVGIWMEQANIAIVVENLRIGAALQRGWQVFRDNLGTMILMGLILIVGFGLIGSLIIAAPLLFIALPVLLGLAIDSQASQMAGWGIAGLCLVVYIPVLIVLGGMLKAYIEAAWTLTYLRITGKTTAIEPVAEVIG